MGIEHANDLPILITSGAIVTLMISRQYSFVFKNELLLCVSGGVPFDLTCHPNFLQTFIKNLYNLPPKLLLSPPAHYKVQCGHMVVSWNVLWQIFALLFDLSKCNSHPEILNVHDRTNWHHRRNINNTLVGDRKLSITLVSSRDNSFNQCS